MALDPAIQWFILVAGILYTIIVGMAAMYVRKFVMWKVNRGKTLLARLNSNNKGAKVELVKAEREGYQIPNGPYVKFEGDFAYIEREQVRQLFVANEDTGFVIRSTTGPDIVLKPEHEKMVNELRLAYPAYMITAKTGETEEMDGMVMAEAKAGEDVQTVMQSHGKIDWTKIAVIILFGVLAVVGLTMWGASKFFELQASG